MVKLWRIKWSAKGCAEEAKEQVTIYVFVCCKLPAARADLCQGMVELYANDLGQTVWDKAFADVVLMWCNARSVSGRRALAGPLKAD